jgi:hypothetical protein
MGGFHHFSLLRLPEIRPQGIIKICEFQINKIRAKILYSKYGSIIINISNIENGCQIFCDKTLVIEIEGVENAYFIFELAYDEAANKIEVSIDGQNVNLADALHRVAVAQARPSSPRIDPPVNITGISLAVKRRRQRLKDLRKNGLASENINRRWADLKRECRLISHAIAKVEFEDIDHVVNIGNGLRKLIGRGKGNGFLQDCASFKNLAILVWSEKLDQMDFLNDPANAKPTISISSSIFSLERTKLNCHQIDLDMWLEQKEIALDGRILSHIEIIHEIGDKIGAHLDLKNREIEESLSGIHLLGQPALSHYLCAVAKGVVELSNRTVGY